MGVGMMLASMGAGMMLASTVGKGHEAAKRPPAPEQDYRRAPGPGDPNVLNAGWRAGPSANAPRGQVFSAAQFATRLPLLIGRR